MKIFLILLSTITVVNSEVVDSYKFSNQQDEKRYQLLIDNIRCPVCQGQSIGGSNAPLAKDLRNVVKNMIDNKNTNDEIIHFMTSKYGDFASFKPPLDISTYLLWFAPFIFIFIAIIIVMRKRNANNIIISDDKLKKAEELLNS